MASILDRYGIKEVADVTFYEILETGLPGNPVLFLDTLKVSTLEQTAETAYAQGGKGNARLIGWDFGKEITLSIEDALFSPKSMAIMFGNGIVNTDLTSIRKTLAIQATAAGTAGLPTKWTDVGGVERLIPTGGSCLITDEAGVTIADPAAEGAIVSGQRLFMTFDVPIQGQEIVVGANTFPGTYYVTGDTYARNDVTGKDERFQFIVPKGKVTSENTITLEAEGDPSVFNMNIDVLRSGNSAMIKLVKYNFVDTEIAALTVSSIAGTAIGDTKLTVTPAVTAGNSYVYKTAASVALPIYGEILTTGWIAWDGTADITAVTGNQIVVVEITADDQAVKTGKAIVTAQA